MRFINDETRQSVSPIQVSHDVFDGPTHTHHLRRHVNDFCMGLAFTQLLVSQILVRLAEISGIGNSGDVEVTQMTRLIIDE